MGYWLSPHTLLTHTFALMCFQCLLCHLFAHQKHILSSRSNWNSNSFNNLPLKIAPTTKRSPWETAKYDTLPFQSRCISMCDYIPLVIIVSLSPSWSIQKSVESPFDLSSCRWPFYLYILSILPLKYSANICKYFYVSIATFCSKLLSFLTWDNLISFNLVLSFIILWLIVFSMQVTSDSPVLKCLLLAFRYWPKFLKWLYIKSGLLFLHTLFISLSTLLSICYSNISTRVPGAYCLNFFCLLHFLPFPIPSVTSESPIINLCLCPRLMHIDLPFLHVFNIQYSLPASTSLFCFLSPQLSSTCSNLSVILRSSVCVLHYCVSTEYTIHNTDSKNALNGEKDQIKGMTYQIWKNISSNIYL